MADQPTIKLGVLHCTPHASGHTPNANYVGGWVTQKIKELYPQIQVTEVDAGRMVIMQDTGHYYEKSEYATYPDSIAVSSRINADQMADVHKLLLESHAILFTSEVRLGGPTALFRTIVERMQSGLMAPRGIGSPLKNKVAGLVCVGHSDGASSAAQQMMQTLSFFRMIFPPTAYVCWTGSTVGGPTHFDKLKLDDTPEVKVWASELAGALLDLTKRQVRDGKITAKMLHADAFKPNFWPNVRSDMLAKGFPLSADGANNYLSYLLKKRRMSRQQLLPYWAVLRSVFNLTKYPE